MKGKNILETFQFVGDTHTIFVRPYKIKLICFCWIRVSYWFKLEVMPECRCRTGAVKYRKKCRCRTNFCLALRHLNMIVKSYYIARLTPSAAVMQGLSLSTANSMNVHGVSLSTASGMDVHSESFFTASIMEWMCRVYPFFKCQNVRHPVSLVPEWTKNAIAGTRQVPE